jgi:hypothetical protein
MHIWRSDLSMFSFTPMKQNLCQTNNIKDKGISGAKSFNFTLFTN